MVYTVGEIAKKMNVAASTIRYYDKEGLLPFVERSEGGIRMFRDEDMEWLLIIDCLKKRLEMLNFKTWYYEEAQRRGTALFYKTVTPEEVPTKYHSYFEKKWKEDTKAAKAGMKPKQFNMP